MLPTFVIGLREGLEAALIVGIIAAFLRKQGRRELLRWVCVGVSVAVLLCIAVGVGLQAYSKDLPQRQQEGLETIIGVIAVGMVTYMVVWMRRNARQLKGHLEGMAADAMGARARGRGARAMVGMAFLAVIREGLETVLFLLAAFNEASSGASAGIGASSGILVAVALGYGIYRGGVHLNLSKFFRATGLVLVLVAAGLAVNALHTAHEAGWLSAGQGATVDLSWLVEPGTIQSSLLTGMLGIQPHPAVIEGIGWLVYLLPVGCYVAWPPGKPFPARFARRAGSVVASVGFVCAVVLASLAPSRPASPAASAVGRAVSTSGTVVHVRSDEAPAFAPVEMRLMRLSGPSVVDGLPTVTYRGTAAVSSSATTLRAEQIVAANAGRLPIGLRPTATDFPATLTTSVIVTAWVEPRTATVVDMQWTRTVRATLEGSVNLQSPLATTTVHAPEATNAAAVSRARLAVRQLDRRDDLRALALWVAVGGVLGVAFGGAGYAIGRRRPIAVAARTAAMAPAPAELGS